MRLANSSEADRLGIMNRSRSVQCLDQLNTDDWVTCVGIEAEKDLRELVVLFSRATYCTRVDCTCDARNKRVRAIRTACIGLAPASIVDAVIGWMAMGDL
jgi:hypothetical protein